MSGATTVKVNAGDTLSLAAVTSVGSFNINPNAVNWITIERVGN
jgi:hypothetical protein